MAILNNDIDERGDVHLECDANVDDNTKVPTKITSSVECQRTIEGSQPINDILVGDSNISASVNNISNHCANDNELATSHHYLNNKSDNYHQSAMLQDNAMHPTDEGGNNIAAEQQQPAQNDTDIATSICSSRECLSASINEENDNNRESYPSTKTSEECSSFFRQSGSVYDDAKIQASSDDISSMGGCTKPPSPMTVGSSLSSFIEDTKVDQNVNADINNDDHDINNQIPATKTDTNNEGRENVGIVEQQLPQNQTTTTMPNNEKKSVKFAPTNTMKEFDDTSAVTSLLQLNESNVQLYDNSGKESRRPKRKKKHTMKVPTAGIYKALMNKSGHDEDDDDESLLGIGSLVDSIYSDSVKPTTSPTQNSNNLQQQKKQSIIRVALLHSHSHTRILHQAMKYIHQDRDILLESLLKWCGIFQGANANGGALSSFLTIVPPRVGTRKLLEMFHGNDYLDLLESPPKESAVQSTNDRKDETAGGNYDDSVAMDSGDDSMIHLQNLEDCNSPKSDASEVSAFNGIDEHESSKTPFSPPPEEYLQLPSDDILAKYGLEDDCPYPTSPGAHSILWKYCLAVTGASWHAASLLTSSESENQTDVAIHWGGGRHHAHANKAGGFCYVSDVILAIHRLIHSGNNQIDVDMFACNAGTTNRQSIQRNLSFRRVLYVDIDIHHADAVQAAFYATDKVLTASFHRYSPGFFPASSGATSEKGEANGLGYNLNVPLPAGIGDVQFIKVYRKALLGLVKAYDPHVVVLCVGADGLDGDELISGSLDGDVMTGDGWNLSPEGLAECVRIAAALCGSQNEEEIFVSSTKTSQQPLPLSTSSEEEAPSSDEPKSGKRRKLLVLGGGGYTPAQTARTYLLCTAAACEGSRPGMFWHQLPRDIPSHEHFPRYGPLFELVSDEKKAEIFASYSSLIAKNGPDSGENEDISASDQQILRDADRTIELATLYIDRQKEKKTPQTKSIFCYDAAMENNDEDAVWLSGSQRKKKNSTIKGGGRRKKKRKLEITGVNTYIDK